MLAAVKELKRRCDCVVAKPNGQMTDTRRVDRNIFKTLGSPKALPFLSGNQKLSGGLGITGTGCGLSMAAAEPADNGSLPPSQSTRSRSRKVRELLIRLLLRSVGLLIRLLAAPGFRLLRAPDSPAPPATPRNA